MNARWVVAGGAALLLAAVSVPVVSRSLGVRAPGGDGGATTANSTAALAAAGVCDPKAKAAKLDFKVKDMHGAQVNLAAFKGKVILLNFWATWCGPCKYEIPLFVELQQTFRDQGLVVLGVSVDDPVDKLKPFAAQYKMNYPVLVGADRDDIVEQAYGPMWAIPVTYVIGRDGRICQKLQGMPSKEPFERMIKSLL